MQSTIMFSVALRAIYLELSQLHSYTKVTALCTTACFPVSQCALCMQICALSGQGCLLVRSTLLGDLETPNSFAYPRAGDGSYGQCLMLSPHPK